MKIKLYVMKTDVKNIYSNTYELIHEWCNNKLRSSGEYYIGDYNCTKDDFYVGTLHVATRINGVIYLKYFSRINRFGRGYDIYDIDRAIPSNVLSYIVDTLPTKETFKTATNFAIWFKHEFINKNTNSFDYISYLKEFISNNRYRALRVTMSSVIFTTLDICPDEYIDKYKKTIEKIRIKGSFAYPKWVGWSQQGYLTTIDVDCTIGDLFTHGVKYFFTDKELEWYNFKVWHINDGYTSIHQSRKVWESGGAEKRSKQVAHLRELKDEQQRRKQAKQQFDNYKKFIDKLEEWKNTPELVMAGGSHLHPFQSIKLVKGFAVTTLRVKVSLEEIRKGYKLFRLYVDNNIEFKRNDDNITIHNYNVLSIKRQLIHVVTNNELVEKKVWCITIGCHTVPEFEITDFINRNNLNW